MSLTNLSDKEVVDGRERHGVGPGSDYTNWGGGGDYDRMSSEFSPTRLFN